MSYDCETMAVHPNYYNSEHRNVTLSPLNNYETVLMPIVLSRENIKIDVSGTVVDFDSKDGLAHAKVYLIIDFPERNEIETMTDSKGHYKITTQGHEGIRYSGKIMVYK